MAKRFVQTPTGEAIDLRYAPYGSFLRRMRPGQSVRDAALREEGFGNFKLDPTRPARTISKMMGTGFSWMAHWASPRSLTTFEAQVLTGFPPSFTFTGDFEARWARIGNCVPPPLARSVAEHVVKQLRIEGRMPKVISTFSGCGGSSLGYKLAGCEVRLAVEWDADAVETYRANFPDTPVFHGDIASLTSERALELAGLAPGELDVLDGSPPCQGFSTMRGARDADDKRNRLFEEYARLLRELRPRAFVMENVKGMVMGQMRPIFDEVMATLRACGYRVRARVLNAKWYGVPQSRERVIFIGFRDDLGVEPSHPDPTVERPITAGEALAGCPQGESFALTDRYGRLWRRIRPGERAFDVLEAIGAASGFGMSKLDPRKPARTIVKMVGGKGFATMCHWESARSLSTEEAQRLAGFPDSFRFTGDFHARWARIGNCVPPPLMRAVASRVVAELARLDARGAA